MSTVSTAIASIIAHGEESAAPVADLYNRACVRHCAEIEHAQRIGRTLEDAREFLALSDATADAIAIELGISAFKVRWFAREVYNGHRARHLRP